MHYSLIGGIYDLYIIILRGIVVSHPKVLGKGYDRFTKSLDFTANMTDKQKEKEAKRVAVLFEGEVLDNKFLDGNKITLAEYIKIWWRDYAVKELALSTQVHYRMRLDSRVLPALGIL